jgi:hypothetical protein
MVAVVVVGTTSVVFRPLAFTGAFSRCPGRTGPPVPQPSPPAPEVRIDTAPTPMRPLWTAPTPLQLLVGSTAVYTYGYGRTAVAWDRLTGTELWIRDLDTPAMVMTELGDGLVGAVVDARTSCGTDGILLVCTATLPGPTTVTVWQLPPWQ